MWRTHAVLSMLIEDIACLQPPAAVEDREGAPIDDEPLRVLQRAINRARRIIALDVVALLILILFRDVSAPLLPGHHSIEVVFTIGVLAVAAHAGFRAGQLWTFRNVARLCQELQQREDS